MSLLNNTLNTRLQLKIDTWGNWGKFYDSTAPATEVNAPDKIAEVADWSIYADKGAALLLKRGEIALCEIPTGSSEATTAPTILFKVGDGTSRFCQLKWASALAADVHSWAKVDKNTFLKDLAESSCTIGDTTYEFLTAAEVNALIAELSSNVYKKNETMSAEEIEAAISTALDGVTGGENGEGLYSRMTAVEQAVAGLDNTYATDDELADAVKTINEELGKKSENGHKHEISDVNGLQDALDDKAVADHNHDGVYSPIGHNHDGVYSSADHTHADLTELINGKSDKNHTHSYEEITDKPTEFNPTAHDHEISEVNGLTDALAGKADKNLVDQLNEKLTNVSNVMDFRGAVTAKPTSSDGYQNGDVIVVTDGDDKGKEFVLSNGEWVEFGNTTAELAAIDANTQAIEAIYKKDGETESGVLMNKLAAVNETTAGLNDRITALESIETLIINCGTSTEVI